MKRILFAALTALLVSVFVPLRATAQTMTRTLAFEEECLDLDTDTVDEDSCRDSSSDESSWDILVGYHADRSVRAVIFQNHSKEVEIAHLENATFDEVTAADIAGAPFTRDPIDQPFDSARVILIRTDLGAVYKLGNVLEGETGLSFDYALL